MSKFDFPIFLTEADVKQLSSFCFQFQLPEHEVGRSDVLIYVEYERTENDIVLYQAWGQIKNSYVRAFLCASSVALYPGTSDVISKIMFDLNSSAAFYEQVHSFLDHYQSLR